MHLSIKKDLDSCLLKSNHIEQLVCLEELKKSTMSEATSMIYCGVVISIIIVGLLLFVHKITKGIPENEIL